MKRKILKSLNTQRRTQAAVIVAFLCFAFMLILNIYTPYTSDDYAYHFVYESPLPSETTRLLSGIGDIPYSMANHYNIWGGRVVAHSIVQFFMLFDKWVFDIFNSLIFALCGIIIYFHIEKDYRKHSPLWLAVIYFSMWFFIPQFGVSVLWVSGACNYIWMSTLILAFLLLYRYGLTKKLSLVSSLVCAAAVIPFGFITGCTNENAGGAAILTAVMFTGLNLIKQKRIPFWSITGLLSAAAGFIFLVIAPGNTARGGKIRLTSKLIFSRLERIGDYTAELMWLPLICLAALVIVFCITKRDNYRKYVNEFISSIIFFICAAANIVVLAATSSIYRRSWLLSLFYIIIACGLLIKTIEPSKTRRFIKYSAAAVFAAAFIFSYAAAAQSIFTTYREVQLELSQIQQQKAAGITDVTVTPHRRPKNTRNALQGTANITNNREQWFNLWIAKYYGVDSVGTKPIKSE